MREMWALGLPQQITLIMFFVGAPFAIVYPFIWFFVKWNKTRIGRSMVFKGIALALIFIQGWLSLYHANDHWFPWLVAFDMAWLTFAVIYQTTTIVKTIREGRMESRLANNQTKELQHG